MDPSRLTLDDLIDRERACGVPYGPFWRSKYVERAPERIRRQLELAARYPELVAMRAGYDTSLSGLSAASASPVTAGVETNLWDPSLFSAIPAGDASPGTVYVVSFGGVYSNRTLSTPASTWTPRWGQSATPASNTLLGASAAVYTGAALAGAPLFGEFVFAVRAIGAAGSGTGNGFVARGNASPGTIIQPIGGALATIDTTVAAGLVISHTYSATNASNTLTIQWVSLRVLN